MLNLSHLELSYPHNTVSRCDFVSKPEAELRSCERKSSPVELQQLVEVHKHPLCSLWSQISNKIG